MRTFSRILTALSAGALLSVLAIAPAAAEPLTGTLTLVNGVPGAEYDVCHQGKTVTRDVAYGHATRWTFAPGVRYRVREHAAIECSGPRIAVLVWPRSAVGYDYIVVSHPVRRDGHVTTDFDEWQDTNTIVGPADPLDARMLFANAGTGPVDLWVGSAIAPAKPGPWFSDVEAGESRGPDLISVDLHPLWVTEVGGSRPFPRSRVVSFREGEITTVILVGTTATNARMVVLRHAYAVVS